MSLAPKAFESAVARIDVSYRVLVGQEHVVELKGVVLRPGQPFTNDCVEIASSFAPHKDTCSIVSIRVKAFKPVELVHFEAKYFADLKDQRMLANGFQSWSQARELTADDRIPSIRSTVAYFTQLNLQGDYDFFAHSGEKGHIHSSSYTHFRDVYHVISFFGSLSENLGYTYFKGDFNSNTFGIYKDVLGKRLDANQDLDLIKILVVQTKGSETQAWDIYAEFFPDKRALKGDMHRKRHVNGWTSWYNYYGDVSEKIVLQNLEGLKTHKYPINIFQIDDGFQTAIGDWLSINEKFPSGLKAIVDKISQAGYTAGLWLAPYAVGFQSRLATEHPDWLVIDPETSKPVVAGPNWGGFYALDVYHPEARAYLKKVFDTVLREWGFGMVKLDFLFAAAMIPRLGKSRGEIMWDAMEFVRELTGPDKLLLGCGVPLACAWRKADYCRIGSDVAPWWEDTKLKYLHVRERVSTANSLVSTLYRWAMSDRMFGNDPDVMILRDSKNKLNPEERYTLCVLNNILGALVFSSDNVSEYGKDEHLLYSATFPKVIALVDSVVEFRPNLFMIRFRANNLGGEAREYTTFANLSREDQKIYLPASSDTTRLLFVTDNEMHMTPTFSFTSWFGRQEELFYHPSSSMWLKSHETKTFMHIPPAKRDQVLFMGSKSHIVPGAEIANLSTDATKDIQLSYCPDNARKHTVYVAVGEYLFDDKNAPVPSCTINGVQPNFEFLPVLGSGEGKKRSHVLVAVINDE